MTKISTLPQDTSPTGDDYTVTVDTGSGQTKKVLLSDLITLIYDNYPATGWSTWTPSWNNLTVGSGVVTAKYIKVGRVVTGYIKFAYGSGSSVGSNPTFTAPITAASQYGSGDHNFIGSGYAEDLATAGSNIGLSFKASTTLISVMTLTSNGTYGAWVGIASGVPITWATGDFFNCTFVYESAS